ncbi:MAG: rhodanese-like domain-containing protein [Bdellovibrionaceae bacterium]|nr:rhodanese-like domain-containing protein [Pseudobdellovibrionaceae bacterium]
MNSNSIFIAVLVIAAGFFIFSRFKSAQGDPSVIKNYLDQGGLVVDVRTPGEFSSGNRAGSVNIPLDQLTASLNKLDKKKPLVVCCASGVRSAQAVSILKEAGFAEVVNGGGCLSMPQ